MQFPTCRRRVHGLTLVDLIAAIVLCVLVFAALVPAAGEVREASARAACAANLKQLSLALFSYANQANGVLPRTRNDRDKADEVTAYTGVDAKDPFGNDGPAFNDVTAPLYLLVRKNFAKPEFFVCPGTNAKPLRIGPADGAAERATDLSNFPSEESLSYSLSNPYASKSAFVIGWTWNVAVLPPDFALVADMNPGGKMVLQVAASSPPAEMSKANSLNHNGAGQNVLYVDGHVAFQTTPFCGAKDVITKIVDNIYTRSTTAGTEKKLTGDPIMGPPSGPSDSVLLPVVGYRPAAKAK